MVNDRPVILFKQSAMAVLALAILPASPEGTKAMVMGLSGEPSSPALAVGILGSSSQTAGGTVGAGAAVLVAAGAAVVAVASGAAVVAVASGALVGSAGGW